MKILIIHNTLNDSTSVSGVLKHYAYMANEWIAAGHQTDFLVARAGFPQLQQLAPQARLINSDNIFNATRYLQKTWRYFPAYGWRWLTAHWVRLPERYDVVYASGQFILEVYCAMVIARRCRSKLVVKVQHVLHSQPKRHGLINRLFLWSERQSARWIHCHFDRVLCLTQPVAEDYRTLELELGLEPTRTLEVGCGIDVAALQATPPQPKQYDVVFLGRMHEQKGVFDLPDFWKAIVAQQPDAKLLVIGEGPHRFRCEEMMRERGLTASATFTGGISEAKKNELLAQAKVGISLSYEEGWGLSVTEFLAMGLPVVAYELPVFARIFPGQLLLVPPGDHFRGAQETLVLLQDEPQRHRLGERGRRFAQRYDYHEIARAEGEILKGIVAPRKTE